MTLISRFTPSLMPRESLEHVFVARHALLQRLVDRIDEAADSPTRNHTLMVGPRGSGKTHLIALAYYAARDRVADGRRLQLAWLPEDPWTIVSYRHLLSEILDRLEPEPPKTAPASAKEEDLESRLVQLARDRGVIVVFVENLDEIIDHLGVQGQQRLRHLVQSQQPILFVATTTRLDRNLSDQARPFYGFFTTSRLAPFTVEQARDMLCALARESGDIQLADHLEDPRTLPRLRTIAHLAGGQPRLWSALSTALTIDRLDSLVDLLLTRFDDLTPYYQQQLGTLSPQQRLITAELAAADHAVHVAELAQRLGIDQRSIAKSISELAERGWVRPVDTPVADLLDRRRTYYELAEPLARLSFQVKESRGKPLPLVVDFLKGWFDPPDLSSASELTVQPYLELAAAGLDQDPVTHVARQLTRLPATRAPALGLLGDIDDALAEVQAGRADLFLRLPVAIRTVIEDRAKDRTTRDLVLTTVREEIHRLALSEVGLVPHPTVAEWVARAEGFAAGHAERSDILFEWLAAAWRLDEAAALMKVLIDSSDVARREPTSLRATLADAYLSAGRSSEAVPLWELNLAETERVLGADHPDTLRSRNNLAHAYQAVGRLGEAIPLFEKTLADFERVLGGDHPDTLTAGNNLARAYQAVGRLSEAIALDEQTLADREQVLGADHPDTLASRNNLGYTYQEVGRLSEAIALYEQTLTDSERVLGADHPNTLTFRHNLAGAYQAAGRLDEAIALYEQTLADSERVLGADHPNTREYRQSLKEALAAAKRQQKRRVRGRSHQETAPGA